LFWLFVWKINDFEALKNRTNVCTNPINIEILEKVNVGSLYLHILDYLTTLAVA
jgi:hypothetical protein